MNADGDTVLDRLTERLELAAARLRSGELDADQAAALVEDCAGLASEAAGELDRAARAPLEDVAPGQVELL